MSAKTAKLLRKLAKVVGNEKERYVSKMGNQATAMLHPGSAKATARRARKTYRKHPQARASIKRNAQFIIAMKRVGVVDGNEQVGNGVPTGRAGPDPANHRGTK